MVTMVIIVIVARLHNRGGMWLTTAPFSVLPSDIEHRPDLQGYVKFASQPKGAVAD